MKRYYLLFILILSAFFVTAQTKNKETISAQPEPGIPLQTVEASCGQCRFGLEGKGCSLAVRINGHAYFVDGTDIHSHGDAHAADGFCEKIRTAEVQGKVVNKRFKATYFKPVADKEEKLPVK